MRPVAGEAVMFGKREDRGGTGMDFRIVSGPENMDIGDIVRLLRTTYWAAGRPEEVIFRSVGNSFCYGVFAGGGDRLAGFARVISDLATAYYLCDVVVDPAYRGRGLGTALVSHIVSLPEYAHLRGFLITRDAQDLYRKAGFEVVNGRVMVRPPDGSGQE